MDGVDGVKAAHEDKEDSHIDKITKTLLWEGQDNLYRGQQISKSYSARKNKNLFCFRDGHWMLLMNIERGFLL